MTDDVLTGTTRRTFARTAGWALPVVSLAAAAPAAAASTGAILVDVPSVCVRGQQVFPQIRLRNQTGCSIFVDAGYSVVFLSGNPYALYLSSSSDSQATIPSGGEHTFTAMHTTNLAGSILPSVGDAVDVGVRFNVYSSQCGDNGYHSEPSRGFVFAC